MSGILFNDIIFGPIHSRRLGCSLGINLLPKTIKLCTFNCIYCECGWAKTSEVDYGKLHKAADMLPVMEAFMRQLAQTGPIPDSITYSGNGEPTLHPEFGVITDGLMRLRDTYFPKAIISCLSNSTQLHRPDVVEALRKIENPMLKLDAGTPETFHRINQPFVDLDVETVTRQLEQFEGQLTVQSLFLRGTLDDGTVVDNTTEAEVEAWLERIRRIHPHTVMLYPIDRETPARKLVKVGPEVLEPIANSIRALGITAKVY
ncbi:MAG: radical SAM protein [Bacteroidales bacterium]|nr:radical SAM protein [Bacteroidales bacterium]